jgi:hypothetical protein
MVPNASILRLTWAVVEETSPRDILSLPDTLLVKTLLQHITQRILLSGEEICALYGYLGSKVTLIRDMAESRLQGTSWLVGEECVAMQAS